MMQERIGKLSWDSFFLKSSHTHVFIILYITPHHSIMSCMLGYAVCLCFIIHEPTSLTRGRLVPAMLVSVTAYASRL